MHKLLFPLLFAFSSPLYVQAQHCPFDGGVIVVIKLTGPDGRPVTNSAGRVFLAEQPNPKADSCTYANELLQLPFDLPQKNLVEKYSGTWEERASLYLKDCIFNQPGYFVVVLNQAQHRCMVSVNGNYRYDDRHFDIRRISDTENKLLGKVPANRLYPLCTATGKWSRIEAIEISL